MATHTDASTNREAWLTVAIKLLKPVLAQAGAAELDNRNIRVSTGFPAGNVRKVVGQCHYEGHNGGFTHIFVSPTQEDPITVLGILVHELIHAEDQGKSGHNGRFRQLAKTIGLTGKMTATTVGEDLQPVLEDIAQELGPYPHTKLNLGAAKGKTQTTRMVKVTCSESCECGGYTVRTTQKWLEVGLPRCPAGSEMELAD